MLRHRPGRILADVRNITETNEQFRWAQCAFIESSVEGQVDRELTEPIPVEQYLTRRERNIAVFPLLSLIYYNYQLEIPQEFTFHKNARMNKMWRLLARMGIISNDMLSMRREIMHGQYESLIPLLMYHDGLYAQKAMDRAGDMLHECYRKFNELEIEFYKEEVPAELHPTFVKYLKACKDLIVCNLHWSYGLRRYMDPGMLQADGRVVFPIRLPPKEKKAPAVVNSNGDVNGNANGIAVSAVSAKPTTSTNYQESRRGSISQTAEGWTSVFRSAMVPLGLAVVAVFASEAYSLLRRR